MVEESGDVLAWVTTHPLQGRRSLRVLDRQTETQGALKDWVHTARSVQDIFTSWEAVKMPLGSGS